MKREPQMDRIKKKNQVNTKALYWVGGIIGALVLAMVILISLNV